MTREDFFPDGRIRAQPYIHVDLPQWMHRVSDFVDLPLGVVWGDPARMVFVDPHTPYSIHKGTFNQFCAESDQSPSRGSKGVPQGPGYPTGIETCSAIQQGQCDSPHLIMDLYSRYLVLSGEAAWSTMSMWGSGARMPLGMPGVPPWLNLWWLDWMRPAHAYIPSHDPRLGSDLWVTAIKEWLVSRFPEPAPWERERL